MTKTEDRVGRVYDLVRRMAENFEFKPESQINEVALAKSFGTSRTPVREALNRLVAEGFLTFQARRGFFCRPLSPSQILSLYEARIAVETEAVRLAIRKSSDSQLVALVETLRGVLREYDQCKDPRRLLELDEQFHVDIAKGSKNQELVRILENLNARIRFVRLIDLKNAYLNGGAETTNSQIPSHLMIMQNIADRDEGIAVDTVRKHIERRREETTEAVAKAFAEIYFVDDDA
ncbi:GntR family transcriptional regulator [Ruegeria arenilitoris]|uniref:GntR family transcriptional regulator n=1 Tax=Ruegeria arenilitoris TaxID=1173585 RepID=UPI003C7AACC8